MKSRTLWLNLISLKQRKQITVQFLHFAKARKSNAQYERKFKHWSFRKNLKKKDWVAVVESFQREKEMGKRAKFSSTGSDFHPKKFGRRFHAILFHLLWSTVFKVIY